MSEQLKVQALTIGDKEEFLSLSRDFYRSEAVLHEIDERCHLHAL